MDAGDLRARTRQFSRDVAAFCDTLATDRRTHDIARQLQRAAYSEEKNYRAACWARNHNEFVAKICIVAEEADEAESWLQSLADSGKGEDPVAQRLLQEASELRRIFAASKRTALENQRKRREARRGLKRGPG
jgi:four helix bundle protein